MKKTLIFLGLGLLFLFPFLVSAKENVHITSAEVVEKSDDTVELEKISYDNLTLNFKLSFKRVNDFIRYKVTIRNDSNKDYEVRENADGLDNSSFFLYQFTYDKGSNLVKAHSSKELYLTARYMKEIDSSLYENGKFSEKKQMRINLANENVEVNPYTKNTSILILIGLIASIIGLIIAFGNRRYLKVVYGVFLLGAFLIPVIGYALEVLAIEVDSEIEVEYSPEFCFYDSNNNPKYQYLPYSPGITMREYLDNHEEEYADIIDVEDFEEDGNFVYHPDQIDYESLDSMFASLTHNTYTHISECRENEVACDEYYSSLSDDEKEFFRNLMFLYSEGRTFIFMNNPVLDKSVGCYGVLRK